MGGPFKTNYTASGDNAANAGVETNRRARAPDSQTMQDYRTSLTANGLDDMPPAAPDATDEALRKRRAAALTQAGLGMGRKSTLLTGNLEKPLGSKTLLGGY